MKVGIIGCGSIAAVHATCIENTKNNTLVAFADSKIERAEQFAKRYQGRAYVSFQELLANEQLDIVHICTPHYLHVPIAVYALEQGVHVFMEKPPVIDQNQLRQLENIETDRYLGFCFQNRYNKSILKAKSLIESAKMGQINGARGIVTWNRPSGYYTESDWRGRLDTEGGGALMNQAVHTLDLLVYLLGIPLKVDGTMTNHHLKGIVEVEDMMEALITFEGERRACFYATTAYVEDAPPILEVSCEHALLRIEGETLNCYYRSGMVETFSFEEKKVIGKSYWGSGHEACIRDFYQCIENLIPFRMDLSNMKQSILLLLGLYESARTKKEVWLSEIMGGTSC